jgi:CRP/FNR family cyclic AMP-dependent transcriptional regulator
MSTMPELSIFSKDPSKGNFPAGHRFFSFGERGELMYVVVSGEVEITLRGKLLETVGPGGLFGEMALIDHHERSADVIAKTDVEVALIDQKRFLYLVSHHPFFAVEVMKVMAFRLRRFDASL